MNQHHEIKVSFQPSGRSVYVLPGTSLLEAAAQAGIILQTPCGGRGTCGKCRVRVISGQCDAHSAAKHLPRRLVEQGFVLACQTVVNSDAVVDVPAESMFESRQQILIGDAGTRSSLHPAVRKMHFTLPVPSSEDTRSDLNRFLSVIGTDVTVSSDFISRLPAFLRSNKWDGTAVLSGMQLIGLEPGDTSPSVFGLAFDIGTTTVVGTLIDLTSGKELAVAARLNGQVPYGDDVISRIKRIRENPHALADLQKCIIGTANDIITDLTAEAKIPADQVYEIAVAGNSTMQEILCGFDPCALGEIPFVQVFDTAVTVPAVTLGLRVNAGADVYVFPQIESFVGGDTIAGMLAARLDRHTGPVMLVDIGTNGEIVLVAGGQIFAASTAAGPAFEGARITQGMRATSGAIEKVVIDGNVLYNVIGNAKPVGICGTALIDAVAGLLRAGIIDSTGRILDESELPDTVPGNLRKRIISPSGDLAFVLVESNETASGEAICLWQRDIREFQLASAAIRAGIAILLKRGGMQPNDLGALLLAGAFGNFIRRGNARRTGLLPQIPCDRIRFIGNAASLGAKMALLSVHERKYAEELRRNTKHVDLSLDPEFQIQFSDAMMFPESDVDACDMKA